MRSHFPLQDIGRNKKNGFGVTDTHDDVESERIIFFDLVPLWIWIFSVQFNDDITGMDILCNLGFDAFVGCDHDLGGSVEFKEL